MSAEKASNVLGHELFVHTLQDVKKLNEIDKKVEKGEYNSDPTQYKKDVRNVDSSSLPDHKRLATGNASEYKEFSRQMDKLNNTNYYMDEYNRDVNKRK